MPPASTTPKMPLHTPIPAEIKGLSVRHLYNMADRNEVLATVSFANGKFSVDEHEGDKHNIQTFCSPDCFQLVHPHKDDETFVINIRHSCVQGWRMLFTCNNEKTLEKTRTP
ncbi:hypothetical protein PRIPAC_91792 [Pristionchus pacificus]|uniref:Uncharacterized protein n=1 Tax=Pristionchus pacificus TaxID=54126 RepID=A0A2A6BBC3_PRIPA|nr:hypothetical protein PRIPAC_91792 [Pristionchus pacificus]|eukprot:PDM63180.1 hypothetical protein PRIPAC_50395 [Pristionchus pacificus]